MMTAREALEQRIVDESCDGCSGDHETLGSTECVLDDYEHCVCCDCWSHLASRALEQWDSERYQ